MASSLLRSSLNLTNSKVEFLSSAPNFNRRPSDQIRRFITRASGEEEDFEARIERLRLKTSGKGKKAEIRKSKNEDYEPVTEKSSKPSSAIESVFLPPIPLKDPESFGLPIALGFTPYTERLNGFFALIGLSALLLVELATGGSLLKYHDGSSIVLQLYCLLCLGALFIKIELERKSKWIK